MSPSHSSLASRVNINKNSVSSKRKWEIVTIITVTIIALLISISVLIMSNALSNMPRIMVFVPLSSSIELLLVMIGIALLEGFILLSAFAWTLFHAVRGRDPIVRRVQTRSMKIANRDDMVLRVSFVLSSRTLVIIVLFVFAILFSWLGVFALVLYSEGMSNAFAIILFNIFYMLLTILLIIITLLSVIRFG